MTTPHELVCPRTLLLGAFPNASSFVLHHQPSLHRSSPHCSHVPVCCLPPSPPRVQAVEGRPHAKLSRQVEEALSRVSLGVQGNEGFSTNHLLLFIHDLVSDSVPKLSSSEGR